MSVVRCGNRECKKHIQKLGAVRSGISYYCDNDCMYSQQKKALSGSEKRTPPSATAAPIPEETWAHVLERDGYCCRLCGGDSSLDVHHIIYRSTYSNKNWVNEPWNLIVLCRSHHDLVHNNKRFWQQRLLGLTWLSETVKLNLTPEEFEEKYNELIR